MSRSKSPPVVQALESFQQDPKQRVQLRTNTPPSLGIVIRFPTPRVNRNNEITHPEEEGFDRSVSEFVRPLMMAAG